MIDGNLNKKSRKQAEKLMASHFPEGYLVDFEREVARDNPQSHIHWPRDDDAESETVRRDQSSEYEIHCHSKA